MPALPDHYATLGVDETASAKEIKTAYRKLAQQYHPDRNAGDAAAEERFKEIQSAYDILGDEQKRKSYDRQRRDPFMGQGGPGGPFSGFGGSGQPGGQFYRAPDGTYVRVDATGAGPDTGFIFDEGGGLGDLFGNLFGGAFGGGGGRREGYPRGQERTAGRDVDATLDLSFEEALTGGPSQLTVPSGKTVRITIPEGVRNGMKIKLKGQGDAGPSGERGDLFITFAVAEHPRFRREGDDLRVTENVSAIAAMLGTEREIETPYGQRVKVKIPGGTQPGAAFRLRGQGVKTKKGRGDLYVEVAVTVPDLPDAARQSLAAWADEHEVR
ncbi:MAG: J domain-containing protein [Bacteroidota bacterium]